MIRQTADAATSFTVSTTDVDPGTIHVDMRGSEHAELTSIKASYISAVNTTIGTCGRWGHPCGWSEKALSDAHGVEDAVTDFFGDGGDGKDLC